MSIIKVKNDYDDAECEYKYFDNYLRALELLKQSHRINKAILSFITTKDLEVLQKLNEEIENII